MKAEDIKKLPNGDVSCTLNGIILTGNPSDVNQILKLNKVEPLRFEPSHFSETKQKWIPISEMNFKHIENHLEKEFSHTENILYRLKYNTCNYRDYIKQLIKHYDTQDS